MSTIPWRRANYRSAECLNRASQVRSEPQPPGSSGQDNRGTGLVEVKDLQRLNVDMG